MSGYPNYSRVADNQTTRVANYSKESKGGKQTARKAKQRTGLDSKVLRMGIACDGGRSS